MEIKTINKEHKRILDVFTKEIEGFIYRITDEKKYNAFANFKPVLRNAQQLHNNIGDAIDKMDINESEWIYMFPNYLLFAGIGFAAALKDENNEDYVNEETEDLFDLIHSTIYELETMMNKEKFINEKKIINLKKTNK
tara:strand:+ start:1547 stop:1960 length:414 start_codon:yes stop_codon:yes gene_type:complete